MKKEKILIIKTGYSEFLEEGNDSRKVSLGDILRTTCLLNLFKDSHVTWVTDEKALPLLRGNPFISRLLILDSLTIEQLSSEEFDEVINLEKVPGICALSDKIKSWKEHGFRFDSKTGEAKPYDKAFEVLAVSSNPFSKKENQKTAQELLFELVGEKWKGEEYVLGYIPKSLQEFDVALNTQIGQKWPTKSWPKESWDELEEKLKKEGLKVTRQDKQSPEILTNLYSYMDWVNSSKLIVTNDSLGLHLGLALKKKTLGLFGPTPFKEVYFYNRGKALIPNSNPFCMPCFKGTCERGRNCMEDISVETVYNEIKNLLNENKVDMIEDLKYTEFPINNSNLIHPPKRNGESYYREDSIYTKASPTKEELISFENEIIELWEDAKIPYFTHFSGGNEQQLIDIFKNIKKGDYILSTHRGHYHYLLAGGLKEKLREAILEGNSMHIFDKELNFLTSGIVAGMPSIAVGLALALKKKQSNKHVWCFIGDGAEDEGHFYEAVRYVEGHDLPCTFIIEDNDRSVETPKNIRYGKSVMNWPSCVIRYHYLPKYPHAGTDKWVDFSGKKQEV